MIKVFKRGELDKYLELERRHRDEEGELLDTREVSEETLGVEKAYRVRRLADFTGFRFFTLGPVYITMNVPFDILGAFASDCETGEFERHALTFKHNIIQGIEAWSPILEGIPVELWSDFEQYMATQSMRDRGRGLYASVDAYRVKILDPLGVDASDLSQGPDDQALITVFAPSTNKGRWVLNIPARGVPQTYGFRLEPADPRVVQEAQALEVRGVQ